MPGPGEYYYDLVAAQSKIKELEDDLKRWQRTAQRFQEGNLSYADAMRVADRHIALLDRECSRLEAREQHLLAENSRLAEDKQRFQKAYQELFFDKGNARIMLRERRNDPGEDD